MPNKDLPARASLEYLKKLAKERLRSMRVDDARATLASALLAVARDHGFSSWRALKAEVDRRQRDALVEFIRACVNGDLNAVRRMLDEAPALAREADPKAQYEGFTGLHAAARGGHVEVARLLLDRGADPNAREAGDNTYPLHWAAAGAHVDTVRLLLDAGTDVHGLGDAHALEVIGWAAIYERPNESAEVTVMRQQVIELLLERGARHHIFSLIAVGKVEGIRELVEQHPEALDRRRSRFEHGQTPLQFAIERQRPDVLDLLIELGADVDATDMAGQTALATAMLKGNREAARRLKAAGAVLPDTGVSTEAGLRESMQALAPSVKSIVPMISVPDIAKTLEWYTSIGFRVTGRNEYDGVLDYGRLTFGDAHLMLTLGGQKGAHDTILWFNTDQVDALYRLLKSRQMAVAQAALESSAGTEQASIDFVQDIEDMFYGLRQFGIRDLNGYQLFFAQPIKS